MSSEELITPRNAVGNIAAVHLIQAMYLTGTFDVDKIRFCNCAECDAEICVRAGEQVGRINGRPHCKFCRRSRSPHVSSRHIAGSGGVGRLEHLIRS